MQRNTHFFRLFIIGLLLVFKANVSAQTYSVQTSLATSPPYFNYLSHYADQNNHLQVVLTLLDFNNPPINVRLRVRIEGPGYELYTNPNVVVGQPLQLQSGIPLFLTDLDLQPYLQESNLIVSPSGLDINNLPEGYTTICVDVILDGTNQEVISSNNCTSFYLQRYTPSTPSFPICESVLDTNQMFHTFQWTDPIGYTPDANTTIEHTFSLYRWNVPNNFTIFQSDQGLVWRETVNFPMVQISDFDIAFENGGLYVWRVQSKIYSNGMPVQMIENNGISEPCTFYYGEPQSLADMLTDGLYIDLNTDPLSTRKGKAYWTVIDNTPNEGLSTFDKYLVEYRRQPTGNESYQIPWFADTVTNFNLFIYQLEPSTTYEVKVSGIVGTNIGDPTPVETFTTPDPRVYACGEGDLPFFPTNWSALQNAQAGIQVQIGQFLMNTTQLQSVGMLGHYSGKGTISIPFLMGAKAQVTFDDILIDTEYLVREGRVDVVTQGLENWLHEQYGQFVDPIYINGVIDSAYVDSNGVAWAVVDGISIPYTFDPPTYPIVLNDANGNQYTIYPNGDIEISTYIAISEEWNVEPDEVAMFSQSANENRGFDPKEHMQWHENYEIMRLADSSLYFVANKSMAEGEADFVNVELPQGTQASFQLADGTPITSSSLQGNWLGQTKYPSGVKYTLNIPVLQNAGNYQVHCFANNQKVGQLNVVVYSEKQKELIIVPLVANLSITESDIKQKLDETLGEANINVNVILAPQWNDSTFTPTTTISLPTETGLLNKYSDEQRTLRDAYFDANPTATRDAYYLFMVHSFDDPNELGYMVRGRAMGFIQASQADVLNTIAHELGHGIGALEHSWKHNGPQRESTSNLMDYETVAGNLIREQWRELRDLDFMPSMFDDVDDYMNEMAQLSPEVPVNDLPIQYEYIPQQLVGVDQALMVNGGWFVKFKTPSRTKFTHFCLVNGKVIGLFQGTTQYLALSATAYRTKPVQNETYDLLVTGQANAIRFLTTDSIIGAGRVLKDALIGSETIQLIDKYVHADIQGYTYLNGVSCDEINGNYVSGISNGVLTYSTIDCPEQTPCNQTDVIAMVDNDKQAVKNAFISIIESANGGFSWNPVRYIEGNNDIISTKDEKVITEKIRTLNSIRNNTVVGVVSLKGLLNNLYTAEAIHQMTAEVVTELSIDYPTKNLILFLAHYIKQEENGIFTTTPYTCQRVSFATNSDLIDASFTTLDLMNAPNATNGFFQLFTNIKKPYHIVNVYEKYDGSTVVYESENLNDPTKDKAGLPYVKGAFHLVSNSRTDYEQAIFDLTFSVGNFLPSTGITGYPVIDAYITQKREAYAILKNNFEANIEIWEAENLDMPEFWTAGDLDFTNIREHHITKEVIWSEFIIKKQDAQQYVDLAMACGWTIGASNTSIYYEFDVMSNVIDPAIYGVIDALGVVPGIDFLADGAGVIYSTLRANDENVVIYSTALAIPFAGAAIIKAGKKTYAIFAKRVNEQLVDITVKQMDEAAEGWTRISSKVTTDNTKDQAVKELLEETADQFDDDAAKKLILLEEGLTNAQLLTKLRNKFVGKPNLLNWINNEISSNTAVLNKLDELPSTSTVINALETDISALKGHFTMNPNFMDSWHSVFKARGANSVLKTDIDLLEKVTSLRANSTFMNRVGGDQGLEKIIKANVRARCKSCGNSGATFLKHIDEYLGDVENLVLNYHNVDGFADVLTDIKRLNANGLHNLNVEGATFMLRVINDNPSMFMGKITKFEGSIDDLVNGCRFDLKFTNGTSLTFGEFKSYINSSLSNFLSSNSSTYQQFTTYLQSVSSLDDLKYFFDANKISDVNLIKNRFKQVIKNNAEDIFDANENLFKQYNRIGGGKIENLEDFEELVNHSTFDANHIMFDFVILF